MTPHDWYFDGVAVGSLVLSIFHIDAVVHGNGAVTGDSLSSDKVVNDTRGAGRID